MKIKVFSKGVELSDNVVAILKFKYHDSVPQMIYNTLCATNYVSFLNYTEGVDYLTHISTLLSRWVNDNLQDRLTTLEERCSSITHIKDGMNKGWWWRTNAVNPVFGLHKTKIVGYNNGEKFVNRYTTIEDFIGFSNVENILNMLDMTVEVYYNGFNTVDKIILKEK